MASPDDVELRGPCPREVVDVIDAWSQAKRITRTEAVNHILRSWAKGRVHEHKIFARVLKGNPLLDQPAPEVAE